MKETEETDSENLLLEELVYRIIVSMAVGIAMERSQSVCSDLRMMVTASSITLLCES